MAAESRKLSFRVSADFADEIDRLAGLMDQNRSDFLKMAVRFGVAHVRRQMEPEAMLTEDLIARMAEVFGVESGAIVEGEPILKQGVLGG